MNKFFFCEKKLEKNFGIKIFFIQLKLLFNSHVNFQLI